MIDSFKIKNYRGFKDFTIESLARINLIAGTNNVGKTSLLEAFYLNLSPNLPDQHRRINLLRGFEDLQQKVSNESAWSWLFYAKDIEQPIELVSIEDVGLSIHTLTIYWQDREASVKEYVEGGYGGVVREIPQSPRELVFNYRTNYDSESKAYVGQNYFRQLPSDVKLIPLGVLLSSSTRTPEEDVKQFSELDDVGRQEEILNTLRVLDSRLRGLAVSISDGIPMVYGDIGIGRRVPLSQMGEGMVRLLSIVLEIANARKGVVLIDEIENGFHHSVLVKVWRAIAEAARQSDTQIFATTHSLEAIRAAHLAFEGSGNYDLRLHRLDRVDGRIVAVTYDERALDTSVEMNLEVR